jgi:hypothetical protein
MRELSIIRLIVAAGINPRMMQAVSSCLFTTEMYLGIASVPCACSICDLLEGYFLRICSECGKQDMKSSYAQEHEPVSQRLIWFLILGTTYRRRYLV